MDAGHGWLIFALPSAEAAVHPAEENERPELYLMCDDLKAEISALGDKGVVCSEVQEARWGSITHIRHVRFDERGRETDGSSRC